LLEIISDYFVKRIVMRARDFIAHESPFACIDGVHPGEHFQIWAVWFQGLESGKRHCL
jgi:hypothetical protein